MDPIAWSILFCVLMMIAIIVEALTVTMGFFTALALVLAGLSIWKGFQSSEAAGYAMVGVNTVLFPGSLLLAIKLLRRSPMTLSSEIQAGVPKEPPPAKPAHELLGQEGIALTFLRPSGTAQFGDRRVDVVTEGKYVAAGAKVKVIKVSGSIVIVEALG
jgi:membrane-bound serine protease (ClpP class)